jgi:hypothetical protein
MRLRAWKFCESELLALSPLPPNHMRENLSVSYWLRTCYSVIVTTVRKAVVGIMHFRHFIQINRQMTFAQCSVGH